MTIEKHETIILSESESKALELVMRILEGTARESEHPEIKNSAKIAIHALNCFNYYTKTEEQ